MPSKKSKSRLRRPSRWKTEPACSEVELQAIAGELARELRAGDRVLLEGPMGVGKTTFARALLGRLGVEQPPEGSPSFAIAHEYRCPKGDVVHLDFYRIRSELEIEEAGIPAYFWERKAITITEWLSGWAEFEKSVLEHTESPARIWQVTLGFCSAENARSVEISELA